MARRGLVAIEVALAIVVLCGAGLLVKSLSGLLQVSPGLDPHEVLTLQVSLTAGGHLTDRRPANRSARIFQAAPRDCPASARLAQSATCH
jgi:putative ABC transport system permease protein